MFTGKLLIISFVYFIIGAKNGDTIVEIHPVSSPLSPICSDFKLSYFKRTLTNILRLDVILCSP